MLINRLVGKRKDVCLPYLTHSPHFQGWVKGDFSSVKERDGASGDA